MTNKVGAKWKYSGAKRLDDMYDLYVSSAEKPLTKKEYSLVLEECNKEFMNLVLAGREVRIIVKPDKINDAQMTLMARDIAKKVEDEMEYPGQIKVNIIRETRVIEYAK